MRALNIAVIGALLAIPSAARAQDDAPVGGKVGPNLESSPAQRGSSLGAQPYGSALRAGPPAGYAGAVAPGQVVPQSMPVAPRWDGLGSAFVDGHRVLVDPNSNRILRVFN
jgi:hypothetical protein